MTEEQPWQTSYFDQVEAIAADLFQLEGDRRVADNEGDTAEARHLSKAIFDVLDASHPEHLRMLIRMMLMTVDLTGEETEEDEWPTP